MSEATFMDAPPEDGKLVDHAPELGDPGFDAPPEFTGISFASRVHNLILTMQAEGLSFPETEDFQNGIKRKISPGFRLTFRGGYLVIDDALRKSWLDFLHQYGQHYFYNEDELAALRERPIEELLREHPQFNTANVDAFREIEAAIPPAAAELERILDAALAGDEDTLEGIYEAELRGFKREQVLDAAMRALETLHERTVRSTAFREGAEIGDPDAAPPEPTPGTPGLHPPVAMTPEARAAVEAELTERHERERAELEAALMLAGLQPTAESLVQAQRERDPDTAGPEDV